MSLKVKKIFKNFILNTFCLLYGISSVYGSCYIQIPKDASLRPRFMLSIGTRKVDLLYNENDTNITMYDSQEIDAYCNTKFESPKFDVLVNKVEVTCEDSNVHLKPDFSHRIYWEKDLQCSSQNWNLYETNENFVWCPSNATSYVLARRLEGPTDFQYLAGICYDIFNLAFKSTYYTIAPNRIKHSSPSALDEFYTPGLEIKHVEETFVSKSIIEADYNNNDIEDWLKFAQYNYSSIIQNALNLKKFDDHLGSLLDLPWWPNLRLGNWKRYEMALTTHVESQHQSYDILAGVSAVATAPVFDKCNKNYTLTELIDNRNNKIPMYVWNYLRSTSNSSDEIVIIAFNSPFYEFYSEKDVIFCPDKCQEIPWLKDIHSFFRYSPLGIIFCCSSEAVRTSKHLEDFPEVDINTKPYVPVTVKPLPPVFYD